MRKLQRHLSHPSSITILPRHRTNLEVRPCHHQPGWRNKCKCQRWAVSVLLNTPQMLTGYQRAEALRLRLKMAMYKIKTNQTQVPLDALEVVPHAAHCSLSTILGAQPPQSHSTSLNQSQHHEEANNATTKLLPAPILRPTAYSSRKIEYIRSSPPGSPEKVSESDSLATPIATRRVQQLLNMHSATISPEKECGESREDLTSSVVKGRAASSLLELMRAV